MLQYALRYAEIGWPSFPCKGKIPLTGRGFHDASKDPEQLRRWFAKPCNIAIPTGKVSGFFVLDVDVKEGARGAYSLEALEAQHGELPQTLRATTWSSGQHILFRADGVGSKAGVAPGIDVRGDGGYIIAAPSQVNGGVYAWLDWSIDEPVPEIAEAPAWLLALLKDKPKTKRKASIDQHMRNHSLMLIAVRLRKQLGLSAEALYAALADVNAEQCTPPLPDKEIRTICNSVSKQQVNLNLPSEAFTDVWNAKYLADYFDQAIRYSPTLGWLAWSDTHWREMHHYEVVEQAITCFEGLKQAGLSENKPKVAESAKRCESRARLDAMVNLVKSMPGVSMRDAEDIIDSNPYLLNFTNGTLDLRTGELMPHQREHFISKCLPYEYQPLAKCPLWEKFLREIFEGDQPIVDFLQRSLGYSLSGLMDEQVMFFFYGTGKNGKSTLVRVVYDTLKPYSQKANSNLFINRKTDSIPNDIAGLRGSRFVMASESEANDKLSESTVKELTSSEPIKARFLHKEFFEYVPGYKFFFSSNNKPKISGTDEGVWRRVLMVPFNYYVKDADKGLIDKLIEEKAGIMAWLVRGFLAWQENGLAVPEKVSALTGEYREQSDIVGMFLDDKCVVSAGANALCTEVNKVFKEWAQENGYKWLNRSHLHEHFSRRGIRRDRSTSGAWRNKWFWDGLGLLGDEEERPW